MSMSRQSLMARGVKASAQAAGQNASRRSPVDASLDRRGTGAKWKRKRTQHPRHGHMMSRHAPAPEFIEPESDRYSWFRGLLFWR